MWVGGRNTWLGVRSMDVGEDMCQGWDSVVVGRDAWGWGRRMGGDWDAWEEAGMCGRRPGHMGGMHGGTTGSGMHV